MDKGKEAEEAANGGPSTEESPSKPAPSLPSTSNQTNLIARCNGIFAVRKPTGVTSADVVARVKSVLERHLGVYQTSGRHVPDEESEGEEGLARNKGQGGRGGGPQRRGRKNKSSFQLKVGHGGTLDPLASGVLVIGVGTGTKQLAQFLSCTKEYVATGRFGASTDSYDVLGNVVLVSPVTDAVNRDTLLSSMDKFRGEILQVPPIYSALRIDGKRLYEYAREGKELPDGKKIEARKVTVEELELLDWIDMEKVDDAKDSEPATVAEPATAEGETAEPKDDAPAAEQPKEDTAPTATQPAVSAKDIPGPTFSLRLVSSSGFYVRSLIHDLGTELNSAAFMTDLVRTRQGKLKVEDAVEVKEIDLVRVVEAIEKAKKEGV